MTYTHTTNPDLPWDPPAPVTTPFPAVGQYVNLSAHARVYCDPGNTETRDSHCWLVVWHPAHVGRRADVRPNDTVVVVRTTGGDIPRGALFPVSLLDLVPLTEAQRKALR